MPEIETLMIANHAEAINGLLYISGGGWTDLVRSLTQGGPPPVNHIGIALAIKVPWVETNRRHPIVVRIENQDGKEQLKLEGQFEMGRPAGIPEGSDLRNVMAINAEITFPAAGTYRVVAAVGSEQRNITFRVHDGQVGGQPPQPAR
jgi:hypothetical protein